jgi:hypothetical protein
MAIRAPIVSTGHRRSVFIECLSKTGRAVAAPSFLREARAWTIPR